LQFVKDDNKHTDDPRYYGGEVVKMELDDEDNPTCIKATFKLGDEAKKVVDAQPKVGVSIGAQYALDAASGKPINPFLKHIALAHRVQVKNMGNWEKLIAASDYGEALTLDLTDADIEIVDKEGGQDMADNGKVELTQEMLQEILASDEVKTAIASQVTEATSTLRTENESLRNRLGTVESTSFKQAIEAAVGSYAPKGVPKIARDLVQGLLLTFAEDTDETPTIELTTVTVTGEGEEKTETKEELKLSRYEAAIRLLEEFEGFVNLTGEKGSNEEVELSENGKLEGSARKNAIAFLTGKARENNSQ
jgi:regulator of replication initiation timing